MIQLFLEYLFMYSVVFVFNIFFSNYLYVYLYFVHCALVQVEVQKVSLKEGTVLPTYWTVTSPPVTYLVSNRKILAILCAATDFAVQAFIHITIPFIRTVSTIIPAITQGPLWDAATIGAHEEGAIAQASWKRKKKTRHGPLLPQLPVNSQQRWGVFLTWQWILTD